MDSLVISGSDTLDVRDAAAVAGRIKGSVSSKQFGYEDLLCPLIAEACIGVCPKNPASFNVDKRAPQSTSQGLRVPRNWQLPSHWLTCSTVRTKAN